MKILWLWRSIFYTLVWTWATLSTARAGFFDDLIWGGNTRTTYCQWNECGLQQGIDLVWGIEDIETERTLSVFIQDVVWYVLTFVSLIAVIYVIYAGFRILIGNGDEEQLKKSKMTILYVVLGIALMWLAWGITTFIFRAFS